MDKKELTSNEAEFYSELLEIEDLPLLGVKDFLWCLWFDRIPLDNLSPKLPDPLMQDDILREELLQDLTLRKLDLKKIHLLVYIKLSNEMRPCWDGLRRLHKKLIEHNQTIPLSLERWASHAFANDIKPPRKTKIERDFALARMHQILTSRGYTFETTLVEIGTLVKRSDSAVKSAIRNVRKCKK